MGKKIVVTGATGFIGRSLVGQLIQQKYDVTALVRDEKKARELKQLEDVKLISFDMLHPELIPPIPKDSILIHCAWENVRNTLSPLHLERHYYEQLFFLKEILVRGIKKLIVMGSCYEYGNQYGPMTSTSKTMPITPYALAKENLRQKLQILQSDLNFELIWARLFYIHGEGQDSKNVISAFDCAIENSDKVFNMTLGEQLLDYQPIEEVVKDIILLLDAAAGVYNVCSAKPISLRRFLEKRMKEKNKFIELNIGHYPYRAHESLGIWGSETVCDQLKKPTKSN